MGPISDPEIQEAAAKSFGQELDIRRALNFSAELSAKGVDFHWRDENDRAHSESFAFVLAAAGRRSNIDPLGLGEAGIAVGPNGVPAFDPATCQIEGSSVFIAGDVTDDRPLLHEAADEGRIAGFNAAHFPDLHRHRRKTPLSIVFCDPQIAVVGEPAKTLDPERTEVGSVDYGDQGRARVMGQNQGKVRIYGDRSSGRLLGAEMVGPRVEHTAHLLAWVTQRGLTAAEALELPFYHPVIEEGIRTGLRDLARKLGQERPAPCARELDCGPGA